jgi:hypothetical protein
MDEGRQFDKNSKNPALIERSTTIDAREFFGNNARCAPANGLEQKQASPLLDRILALPTELN